MKKFRVSYSWMTFIGLGVIEAKDEVEAKAEANDMLCVDKSLQEIETDGEFEIKEV